MKHIRWIWHKAKAKRYRVNKYRQRHKIGKRNYSVFKYVSPFAQLQKSGYKEAPKEFFTDITKDEKPITIKPSRILGRFQTEPSEEIKEMIKPEIQAVEEVISAKTKAELEAVPGEEAIIKTPKEEIEGIIKSPKIVDSQKEDRAQYQEKVKRLLLKRGLAENRITPNVIKLVEDTVTDIAFKEGIQLSENALLKRAVKKVIEVDLPRHTKEEYTAALLQEGKPEDIENFIALSLPEFNKERTSLQGALKKYKQFSKFEEEVLQGKPIPVSEDFLSNTLNELLRRRPDLLKEATREEIRNKLRKDLSETGANMAQLHDFFNTDIPLIEILKPKTGGEIFKEEEETGAEERPPSREESEE